jgi:hypothetical protein
LLCSCGFGDDGNEDEDAEGNPSAEQNNSGSWATTTAHVGACRTPSEEPPLDAMMVVYAGYGYILIALRTPWHGQKQKSTQPKWRSSPSYNAHYGRSLVFSGVTRRRCISGNYSGNCLRILNGLEVRS